MNEEINWDDAPEGFDLHIDLWEDFCIKCFARDLENGTVKLKTGEILNRLACHVHGTITERPPSRERTFPNRRRLPARATFSYRKPSA